MSTNNKFQLDSLDGLRGLAVLIVFFAHAAQFNISLIPGLDFSGIGKYGVFLFFILSAFLLTYPCLKAGHKAFSSTFLRNYINRRFFRIYPLYVLYLAVAALTTAFVWKIVGAPKPMGLPFKLTVDEFVQHLLLQQGKGVTWSILVEFRYYLALPVVAFLYSVILRNKLVPCIAVTAALIIAIKLIWPTALFTENDTRIWFYLPVFLIGSLLAVFHHTFEQANEQITPSFRQALDVAGVVCLIAIACMTPSIASVVWEATVPPHSFHKHFVTFAVLWSIVLFACVHGAGWIRRPFEFKPLRLLGSICFSFYLIHMVVLETVTRVIPGSTLLGYACFAITAVASYASWKWIELPGAKMRFGWAFRKLTSTRAV